MSWHCSVNLVVVCPVLVTARGLAVPTLTVLDKRAMGIVLSAFLIADWATPEKLMWSAEGLELATGKLVIVLMEAVVGGR